MVGQRPLALAVGGGGGGGGGGGHRKKYLVKLTNT